MSDIVARKDVDFSLNTMFCFSKTASQMSAALILMLTILEAHALGAVIDPSIEETSVILPVVGQITGAVPPTEVPSGTEAVVTGNVNPAIYANGVTGSTGNGVIVIGGRGITATNLSGRGIGVVLRGQGEPLI